MLIEVTLQKPGGFIPIIGEEPPVETMAIKVDGILSVMNDEDDDRYCTIMAIGLKDERGNEYFPRVMETRQSLTKRINDIYLQLAEARGAFIRARADRPGEGVSFSDRGGCAVVE